MSEICESSTARIVPCAECRYLKECRAVCRCNHPFGLKQPHPEAGTFCSFGAEKDDADTTD